MTRYSIKKTIVLEIEAFLRDKNLDNSTVKVNAIKLLRELFLPVMVLPLRDAKFIVEAIIDDMKLDKEYVDFSFPARNNNN